MPNNENDRPRPARPSRPTHVIVEVSVELPPAAPEKPAPAPAASAEMPTSYRAIWDLSLKEPLIFLLGILVTAVSLGFILADKGLFELLWYRGNEHWVQRPFVSGLA